MKVSETGYAFARAVTRHPWITVLLFVAATTLLAARIPALHIDPDVRAMLAKNHPENVFNDWLEDYFDIQDPALLLVINDGPHGVFTPHTLALVKRLSAAIGELDAIDDGDLVSLSEVDDILGSEDSLDVEPFYEDPPATQAEADAIRERVFDNRMMPGALVSRDGHATIVMAEMYRGMSKTKLYDDLKRIVAEAGPQGERVVIAGRPVIEGEMGRLAGNDVTFMFPLVLVAATLLLLVSLRSIRGVLLPMLVVVSSVVWTLGAMAWLHVTFFAISTIMPTLLVAIGVANGIHILHHFMLAVAAHPRRAATDTVFETMQQLTPPLVMTSLTTAAGIGSLAISPMRPIQLFGLFTAVGVLAGMVFSLTVLPAILCLLPLPLRAARATLAAQSETGSVVAWLLRALSPLVLRHPMWPIAVGVVAVAIGLAGLPRIVVEGSLLLNFPSDSPVKLADDELSHYMGGTQPLEIVIDAGEDDGWKSPERLRALAAFQHHLEEGGHMAETRSIADYIARMNEVMNPSDPNGYRIPKSRDLVAQYLLLYSMSGDPDDFEDVIDTPYRMANLRAQADSDRSSVLGPLVLDAERWAQENLAQLGMKTHVSGASRIVYDFVSLIIRGQVRSLAIGLVLVFLLAAALGRSFAAGAFTVLPVAIATILNFGLMGWFGVRLGVTTALLSSMGIGIGVDYAIHFVFRYRMDRFSGMSAEAAMRETLSTAGVAIFYNAIVVLAGFLVLATSEFPPNRSLGVLVSINMFVCLLGTVTLLAALLHRLQPAFVQPMDERTPADPAREAA